jgi:F0F1-type ATP synthase assembly protein I
MTDHQGENSEESPSNTVKDLPGVAALLTMGLTIAITVGIGVFLGIWADNEWGGAPLWLVIGLVLGTVAAVVSVLQQVRRFL